MKTLHAFKYASAFAAACALVFSLVILPSCGQEGASNAQEEVASQEASTAVTFTDDLGNQVTVDNPQRVVACMGSFADIWQLAGGTLVGASSDAFADYGISQDSVMPVGDFSELDLESILACNPDFVILTASSSGRGGGTSQVDLRESLESAGITTAYFQVTTFDDYLRMLRICCDITGRDDLYQTNGQEVAERIEGIVTEHAFAAEDAPEVLLMVTYSQGIRVQGSDTQAGAMLADLGVKNVADQNASLLKDFSLESLVDIDPDYIFVLPMGNDPQAAQANLDSMTSNPAWASLTAVEEGRCILLDAQMFLYKPNAAWDQAYQQLVDAFGGQE